MMLSDEVADDSPRWFFLRPRSGLMMLSDEVAGVRLLMRPRSGHLRVSYEVSGGSLGRLFLRPRSGHLMRF